jgi:pseudaminic acid cytidylyltransferase
MHSDTRVAIIPARGGSKRIASKNIKIFNGVPIIAYPIRAAIESNLFDKVFVSTDSADILSVAKQYGAEAVGLRSIETSNDEATTLEVVKYEISRMKDMGFEFDYLACIYPATPLLDKNLLIETFHRMKSENFDFCFPVVKNHVSPERLFELGLNGSIVTRSSFISNQKTQSGTDSYRDAGQFYWGKTVSWAKEEKIFSENSLGVRIPEYRGIDIDTMENWEHAELVFAGLNQSYQLNVDK